MNYINTRVFRKNPTSLFLNLYNIELLGEKVGWLEVVNFKGGEHVGELSVKKFVFKMQCNLALH